MSANIDSFLKQLDENIAAQEGNKVSADYVEALNATAKAVESWCKEYGLVTERAVNGVPVCYAAESFNVDNYGTTFGPDRIIDLCKTAGVAQEHLGAAARRVAALLVQCTGRAPGAAFSEYRSRKLAANGQTFQAVESLYPSSLLNKINPTGSLETFGINMDRVEPDLKTVLTLGLLQFHTNLTPRILPIQTVTQGNVTIVRESMRVYDMSDTKDKVGTRVIDLYNDPSLVSVRAIRIKPLLGASSENAAFLEADDYYKFQKVINLFDMALVPGKPGYDKYNHTDFVEDNIVLDGVLLKIENSDESGKAFYHLLPIAPSMGRFTQFSNDRDSTDRILKLDRWPFRLGKDIAADTKAGKTSDAAVLAALTGGAQIQIDLHVDARVQRKTSLASASAWCPVVSIVGGTFTDVQRDALKAKFTVTPIAYTLDARYNEDNKRKVAIRTTIERRSMSYELPTGRNFVVDSAIGQDGIQNAAARLAQLEHIGRDYNNLLIIEETMKSVHDQIASMNFDKEVRDSIAAQYAAGDLVNQFVYLDGLDLSGMYGIRSADASGDTKQMMKTYFNILTSELLAKSYFDKQLAENATVVFRVVTSNEIMGELFMVKHIHQHLENDKPGTGGVEHVIELDNGVRLEIVTTTFASMKNKILLIPYLANSQTSVLNAGTDYDQGTLVGAMSVASDQSCAYHRLFSTTRELCIMTNVFGAVIEVTGGTAIKITDASTAELTVLGVTE